MFLDSTGDGKAVARGFHMSRQDAKVVRIEPDKGQVFVEYKEDSSDKKRLVMNIKMYYHGKATDKKYNANVKLTLDTSSSPPRVLDIDYKDDNKIPASKLRDVSDVVVTMG